LSHLEIIAHVPIPQGKCTANALKKCPYFELVLFFSYSRFFLASPNGVRQLSHSGYETANQRAKEFTLKARQALVLKSFK